MKAYSTLAATCALAVHLGACGTITRGTTESVAFQSEPSGAEVKLSNGQGCAATPCAIIVPRKDPFVATFTLAGHKPEDVTVGTVVSGGGAAGMAGNVLFGGVIGIAVDASSGASLDHQPNPVIARLQPLKPVSPLIERRRIRSVPTS